MSISYIDGRYVRNLTEDTSQGAAKYENGDYTRAVVVGNYVQDGVTQSGALNGVPIEFMLDSINNQNIPVINILESHAAALAVLRSYGPNAHAYIPGVGVLNGLTAGNYTDTVGTQAAIKDAPIGLDLDAMGSLGAELVTNGGFDTDTTGWTGTNSAVLSVVSGKLRVTNGAALNGVASQGFTTVVGKSYLLTYSPLLGGTSSLKIAHVGTSRGNSSIVSSNTSGYVIFVATTTTTYISFVLNAVTGDYYDWDNISVKEVTGIHATQGTAGNKPVLRQGPVNMLLNSATLSTQSVAVAASPHTLSFTGTGTVTKSGTATGALVGTGATDRVTQTFTPTAGTLTLTVTGSVTSAQLQLGLAATTYIPTTSAKASAGTGPSYWEFGGDGTPTDYLGLGSVPFQMADDHWVVVAFASNAAAGSGDRVLFGTGSSAAANPLVCTVIVNGTAIKTYWRNDAGALTTLTGGNIPIGDAGVVSAIKKSGVGTLRLNGAQIATGAITGGTTTVIESTIGRQTYAASWYAHGNIYAVLCGKGAITDADLLLIEKLAANLAGVTLA